MLLKEEEFSLEISDENNEICFPESLITISTDRSNPSFTNIPIDTSNNSFINISNNNNVNQTNKQ